MKYMIPLCLILIILCFSFAFLPMSNEHAIYDDVLRLHVIANSDSDADQILKYEIRDEILKSIDSLSNEMTNKEDMLLLLEANSEEIRNATQKILDENGKSYDISVNLCEEYYPTRVYNGINMPAGKYVSLKVEIGEAQGKNWWCVLYPQICNNTARPESLFIQTGFSNEQMEILTDNDDPKYVVKFKILEFFQKEIAI